MALGLRILLVDDDESWLESFESFLVSDGHSTFTARRGFEAVDFARRCRRTRERLDLSILDFRMPGISGIETFEQLVAELPETPGLFLSGEPSTALEQAVERVGGLALMPKPVHLPHIREILDAVQRGIA